MNFTLLIIILALILSAALAVGITVLCVVLKKSKGDEGEHIVAKILGDTIDGVQYVINDLIFGSDDRHSCQIDHVFINRFGIWVIETKNYSGTIFGVENAREWTQCLADGKIINKFYNPIKQNVTHIYRLAEQLKIKDKSIFQNVVVFLQNADISKINSPYVISVSELEAIKTAYTGVKLSDEQMQTYYNALLDLKAKSHISKKEHIKNIHKMQKAIEKGICPRCGARLVLRTGEYGEFFGCSNYPACKFAKNQELEL